MKWWPPGSSTSCTAPPGPGVLSPAGDVESAVASGCPGAVFTVFWGAWQRLEKARVSGGVFGCETCAAGRAGLETRGEEVLSARLTTRLKVNVRPSLRGKLVGSCKLGCE